MWNREAIKHEMYKLGWWHQIELAPGLTTPGRDDSSERLRYLGIPRDLTGKRVLDVGCWDGFFSFHAEKSGAREVVGIDIWQTRGFQLAQEVLGSRVHFERMNAYHISPERLGMFDVVFCFGVYYHLKNPLAALERIASVTKEQALIEGEILVGEKRALTEFVEFAYMDYDPTVWWVPSLPCLHSMVRASGFPSVETVSTYLNGHRGVVRGVKTPATLSLAPSEEIVYGLSSPQAGETVHDRMRIEGWVVDYGNPSQGIHLIETYLDGPEGEGELLGRTSPKGEFPELTNLWGFLAPNSHFKLEIDVRKWPAGEHFVFLSFYTATRWAQHRLRVIRDDSAR